MHFNGFLLNSFICSTSAGCLNCVLW